MAPYRPAAGYVPYTFAIMRFIGATVAARLPRHRRFFGALSVRVGGRTHTVATSTTANVAATTALGHRARHAAAIAAGGAPS